MERRRDREKGGNWGGRRLVGEGVLLLGLAGISLWCLCVLVVFHLGVGVSVMRLVGCVLVR